MDNARCRCLTSNRLAKRSPTRCFTYLFARVHSLFHRKHAGCIIALFQHQFNDYCRSNMTVSQLFLTLEALAPSTASTAFPHVAKRQRCRCECQSQLFRRNHAVSTVGGPILSAGVVEASTKDQGRLERARRDGTTKNHRKTKLVLARYRYA